MNSWFRMSKSNFYCLIILILLCIVSFIPFSLDIKFWGIAVFGWTQGLLMFIAPIVTIIFVVSDKESRRW